MHEGQEIAIGGQIILSRVLLEGNKFNVILTVTCFFELRQGREGSVGCYVVVVSSGSDCRGRRVGS